MADDTLEDRAAQLTAVHEQYMLHFAGQARVTRDVDMLDYLIGATERLQDEAAAAEDPELEAQAAAQVETYRNERQAIASAVAAAGPAGTAAARVLGRAEHAVHRYQRHFAGRSRLGRDISMLAEIDADLRAAKDSLTALGFAPDAEQANGHVRALWEQAQLITEELEALRLFLDSGDAPHRAAAWSAVANSLLAAYQVQFMGRDRLSCRISLLDRLIDTLAAVREQLHGFIPPDDSDAEPPPHLTANVRAVEEELKSWYVERDELIATQQDADEVVRSEALNAAAEDVLHTYNSTVVGNQHDAIDVERVRDLCDRLDEVERQMTELEIVPGLSVGHNLAMTRDALTMLNGLYDALLERTQSGPAVEQANRDVSAPA